MLLLLATSSVPPSYFCLPHTLFRPSTQSCPLAHWSFHPLLRAGAPPVHLSVFSGFFPRQCFLKMLFHSYKFFCCSFLLSATTVRSSACSTFFSSSCSDTFPLTRFIAIMKSMVFKALLCLRPTPNFSYVSPSLFPQF